MRRTRVAHVITRMVRGGARRIVLQLLEQLDPARFEVSLICGPEDADLNEVRAPVTVVSELKREIAPVPDLRAGMALFDLFQRTRPDVVHAHTYKSGVVGSVAARLAGVKAIVFTPHGHIFAKGARIPGVPTGPRLALLRWVTRTAERCADRITALSEIDLEQQVALRLAPREKHRVIRNGIDVTRFTQARADRERWGLDGFQPLLGTIGRLSIEKGHDVLLEAMPIIRAQMPKAGLAIVGQGERAVDLRSKAGKGVLFLGEIDSAAILPSFDVYVHPSYYESQGLAILEAMAAGRPVVATDAGGIRDVVLPGETGLLVPPGNAPALAEAILQLARDRELALSLARRARERVEREFSLSTMIAAYARLYEGLLSRRPTV